MPSSQVFNPIARFPLKKHFYIVISLLSLMSCRTYYDKVLGYHKDLNDANYKAAEKDILNTKFLKRNRNEVLRNLELGKVFHLQQQYDSSNFYFNRADLLMEEKTAVADVSTAVLVNSAMTKYHGEDFERVLVNYYKALNYLYLNMNEDALVEAKRINIRLNELADKQLMQGKKYRSDAFAHTLQGLVYERMNDYNNAFISYRNAYELYIKDNGNEYLGSTLPEQLKIDLINSAHKSGFYADRDEYCKTFNMPFNTVKDTAKQQLIFIWENGLAPVKEQEDIMLFLVKGVGGDLVFSDKSGTINIPFPLPDKKDDPSLGDLNVIRVAFPKYVDVPLFFTGLTITLNGQSYTPGMAENVAVIARTNLKERFLKEMTLMISRIVLKKLAEAQLKKENEAAGALLGIAGALAEKADTRNWQSLPSFMAYTRIPLSKGENTLNLQLSGPNGQISNRTITVNQKSTLGFINYSTLQHFPPVMDR